MDTTTRHYFLRDPQVAAWIDNADPKRVTLWLREADTSLVGGSVSALGQSVEVTMPLRAWERIKEAAGGPDDLDG